MLTKYTPITDMVMRNFDGCSLRTIALSTGPEAIARFATYRFNEPVLLTGLTDHWPASTRWAEVENFLAKHGDLEVALRKQLVLGDDPDGVIQNVSEYLQSCHATGGHIQFTFENLKTFRRLAPEYASGIPPLMPPVLRGIHKKPAFSLGRNGTGSGMHQHEEAWLAQIAGRKVWLVAPPSEQAAPAVLKANKVLPCQLLGRIVAAGQPHSLPGTSATIAPVQLCAVRPGEIIYVPFGWHHATCNLDPFTLGVGGRGDSSKWPALLHSIQTGDLAGLQQELSRYSDGELDPTALNDPRLVDPLPMHLAARFGPVQLLDTLVSSGVVDPLVKDLKGYRAVYHAAYAGTTAVLEYLISTKRLAGLDEEGPGGLTALDLAVMGGHLGAVRWLLDKHSQDGGDGTRHQVEKALGTAAWHGHLELVRYLVEERGAEPEHALGGRHADIEQYLTKVSQTTNNA